MTAETNVPNFHFKPCGVGNDDALINAWSASTDRCPGGPVSGPGLCVLDALQPHASFLPFTFECWIVWPMGTAPLREPVVLAEAEGENWSWQFGFDHSGSIVFVLKNGGELKVASGEILFDSLRSGVWYHVTAICTADGSMRLSVTSEGGCIPRPSGLYQKIGAFGNSGATPVQVSIGRSVKDPKPSSVRIGSAALYSRVLGPVEFPALGSGMLPDGVTINDDFEYGTLGRVAVSENDTVYFEAGESDPEWFAFRVRGAKSKTINFKHVPLGAMGVALLVSEDGGETWGVPSGGVWRDFRYGMYKSELTFSHTFESDDTHFAASPPVTVRMVNDWIDKMESKPGVRVHHVGNSREGFPLRVLEIGNPDAPLIYLQAGQHNMMERIGFFSITQAFEAASEDKELLASSRWMILPVVNVDSFSVLPEDGNMNRVWGKECGPVTIQLMSTFLKNETARTGGRVMLDWHAGTVWRGHTILCNVADGYSDPDGGKAAFHIRRESGYPEFEKCLQAAGLDYIIQNKHARKPLVEGDYPGFFERFASKLPGVKVSLTVELSATSASTPEGIQSVSPRVLREDGVRWYKAIKAYVGRLS